MWILNQISNLNLNLKKIKFQTLSVISEFGNQQRRRQKTKLLILLYLSENIHY